MHYLERCGYRTGSRLFIINNKEPAGNLKISEKQKEKKQHCQDSNPAPNAHNTNALTTTPPGRANFFFGRAFNLEIFLNRQGSEFIQTLLLIYNHLAKFVVYKSWTRSALLKDTSKCFLVSSITCRNQEAIEYVWFEYKLSFVVKLSTKPHPQTGSLH